MILALVLVVGFCIFVRCCCCATRKDHLYVNKNNCVYVESNPVSYDFNSAMKRQIGDLHDDKYRRFYLEKNNTRNSSYYNYKVNNNNYSYTSPLLQKANYVLNEEDYLAKLYQQQYYHYAEQAKKSSVDIACRHHTGYLKTSSKAKIKPNSKYLEDSYATAAQSVQINYVTERQEKRVRRLRPSNSSNRKLSSKSNAQNSENFNDRSSIVKEKFDFSQLIIDKDEWENRNYFL